MKLNDNVEVSFRDGALFRFSVSGTEVLYQCSPLSGNEVVTIDGEIVSKTKNFKFRSSHNFSINGTDYTITFESKNLLKGQSECMISSGGKDLQTYRLKYIQPPKLPVTKRLLPVALGILVGITYKHIPMWITIFLAISLFVSIFIFSFGKNLENWKCEIIYA